MKYKLLTGLILFAFTFPFYLYIQRAHPLIGEEFMLFMQGERAINGEVPYRDFFQFITPGSIYLAGLIFKIFGIKLSVMKVFIALTGSIIVLLTYLISVGVINDKYLSVLPAILTIYYSIPYVPLFYHHLNAEIFVLLTIIFALGYVYEDSGVKLFSAGLCAAFAFLFLQHKGILIFAGLITFLLLDVFTNKKSLRSTLALTITGFFTPLIPFFLYLYLNGAIEKFFYDCFYWVINSYAPFNSLPEYLYFEKRTFTHYLQTEGVIYALLKTRHEFFVGYLPLISIIYGAIAIFKNLNRSILVLYLSSLFLFLSVLTRPDFINIIYIAQPFFVLLVYYLHEFIDKNRLKTLAGMLILGLLIFNTIYECLVIVRNATLYKYPLETPRGIIYFQSIDEIKPYSEVFSILNGELKDKRTFVYNWSTFLYFLVGKKNYTSYDSFLPAYNTEAQMNDLIKELKNNNIEYVIYDHLDVWLKINGERSLYPVGSKNIDLNNKLNEYINSNYERYREFESFKILRLKMGNPFF